MKIIFFWILLFCFTIASGQKLKVWNQSNYQPIAGVIISGNGISSTLKSNADGTFILPVLPDTTLIEFEHPDFQIVTLKYSTIMQQGGVWMSETTPLFKELVLTANRIAETRADIAQQIQLLHAKQIAAVNPPTTAEALQWIPGVWVQKSQLGGGSPVIRGFEANRILLVLDGVRMNNAIYRSGHLQNSITVDANVLERIEVLQGPGAVMYGSDALGGVIYFQTRSPQLKNELNEKIRLGAWIRTATACNEISGNISFNYGTEKWAFFTGVTANKFGDLRTGNVRSSKYPDFGKRLFYQKGDSMYVNNNINLQVGSAYDQINIIQKILFQPNNKYQHLFNFQYTTSSNIPRYDRLSEIRNGLFRFSEWYYGPQQWLFGSYQLRLLAPNRLYNEAKIIAAVQHITESRHTRNFNNPKRGSNIEQVQIVSLNADFNKQIGEQELRYGVEVFQNYVNSKAFDENIYTGARSFRTTRYPDGARFFSGSIYGSHRWELNKKWVLNDGIRFNYSYLGALLDTPNYQLPNIKVHQKNMSLTGQIGLVWRPAEKYWNSLHIATGYRVPNVDDMGKVFEANAGQLIVPNPDLKPERNYSIELNLSYRIYKQVWFSINSYYCLFNNALALQPFRFLESDSVSINGDWFRTFANVNAERATIYGFTTSLGGEINNHWSCNASITYTKGTLKLNSDNNAVGPLDHIPPLFGNINIIYRYKRLTLEGWMRFAGWKRIQDMRLNTEDNERYATADGFPAWKTFNFRTSFQLLKDLQLQMALENILDVHYRLFASGISAPGRNLIVALRKQF